MNNYTGRERASMVLDRYEEPADPFLKQEHEIKPFVEFESSSGRQPVSMLIGTDGASKGAGQTPDRKSFSGWGFYALMNYDSGKSNVASRYGFRNKDSFMFNESPLMAELIAIREALQFISLPTNLKLVTDSKFAMELVKDHDSARSQREALEGTSPSDLSKRDREKIRELGVAEEISNILHGNSKILGMRMEWVGSHALDDLLPSEMPRINDGKTMEDQRLLANLLINSAADALASKGVEKSINASMIGLSHLEVGTSEWKKKTRVASKNFHYSTKTKRIAENVLSEKPPGFLPDETVTAVLGQDSLGNINKLRSENLEREDLQGNKKLVSVSQKRIESIRYNRVHSHLCEFANVDPEPKRRRSGPRYLRRPKPRSDSAFSGPGES